MGRRGGGTEEGNKESAARKCRYPSKLSANDMRRILGIEKFTWDIEVPPDLGEEMMRLRRKRVYR